MRAASKSAVVDAGFDRSGELASDAASRSVLGLDSGESGEEDGSFAPPAAAMVSTTSVVDFGDEEWVEGEVGVRFGMSHQQTHAAIRVMAAIRQNRFMM